MPRKKEAVLEADVQELAGCQHHWVIDRPAGPVSKGTCRLCGEVRDFMNYVEGGAWGSEISLAQLSGSSRIPRGIDVADKDAGPKLSDE